MDMIAKSRWHEFESAMLNAMQQGMRMLGPAYLPCMVFLHSESRERDVVLAPVNLPLTRVKQALQARIDSTPDQRAIDQREARQAASVAVAQAAKPLPGPTVAEVLSQIRRAMPFIENNAANAQGRKMLAEILMQSPFRAENETTQ
jgi:hypothetical protein